MYVCKLLYVHGCEQQVTIHHHELSDGTATKLYYILLYAYIDTSCFRLGD